MTLLTFRNVQNLIDDQDPLETNTGLDEDGVSRPPTGGNHFVVIIAEKATKTITV